jgi:PAS domain S-box-containing protein
LLQAEIGQPTRAQTDQVLAGQQVEARETRFRALVGQSSEVILLSDREGNSSYASPALERVLGYTPEAFVQLNGLTLIHPDDLPAVAHSFQTLLATPGASKTGQFRARHKGGSWRWVEATATNLLDEPSVGAIVTNVHDITARKEAEEAQWLLAAIVTSSDDAIISKTLDEVITSWNDAAERLFGYTAQEALGQPIFLIIPPELRAEEAAILAKLRAGARIDQYETTRLTKEGSTIDVSLSISPIKDQHGTIIGAAKIARDITGRKQLEAKFRRLFDSNLIGVFVSDFAGTFLDANDAFLDLLGYTREELLAGTLQRDALTPAELGWLSQDAVQALQETGASGTYEKGYLHKSGRRIPVLVAVTRIDLTETCIGFVLDITARKRAEEQERFLAEVSKALASTLDYQETLATIARLVVPGLADWFAVELVDAEGRFGLIELAHRDPQQVQWARALRECYPIDPASAVGAPRVVRTGQSVLYAEITDEMLVAAARSEEELAIARQIGYRSVMIVPLIARGNTLGAVTFVAAESGRTYDQRDLALAEEVGRRAGVALDNARLYQEVQQGRDQLEIILQGVADGIVVYDRNSRIIYANEAAAQLTGYVSVQDLLQAPPLDPTSHYEIVDEQGQPLPTAQLTHKRVLAGEREAQATMGYASKGSGGPERWSLVKSRPVYDEQGAVLYVITIVQDVTERVQVEQRKDAFISMASHELKTPVTSLKGFTAVLQRRLSKQGDGQSLQYLSRMDAQLDRLTKLISDLLDLSRMRTGKLDLHLAPVNLDALVAETVENVQAAVSTHRLRLEGKAHAHVLGDRDRLGQVLINLFTNAIKYSPGADCVIVGVSREHGHALVRVQDFGIGIDEVHQQHIFERFYQVTDPEGKSYPGLGIGLHISKEIVERHHGRIEVRSRKGEGATFSVMLLLLREG